MTDRELMQMALDALELVTDLTNHDDEVYEAIEALRARLATEQDEGHCQACNGGSCTAKEGCVALDNPPQREWQGLTDEEIGNIIEASQITLKNYCSEDKQKEYARAIEAKLKEKNAPHL